MDSVTKGLRRGAIEKDTYDRLICAECETRLARTDDPDVLGAVRSCPQCEREWRQL